MSGLTERARAHRDDWVRLLESDGLRAPDVIGETWAKWIDGETVVIVRFGINGTATVDVTWLESDGRRNGMFAPRDCPSVTWLARDIRALLASPTRETIVQVSRPVAVAQ